MTFFPWAIATGRFGARALRRRQGRTKPVRRLRVVHWAGVVLSVWCLAGLVVSAQEEQEVTNRVRLALFRPNETEFTGAAAKNFELRLPRHVTPAPGCQLRLVLRPAKEPVSNAAVELKWNNRVLLTSNVPARADALLTLDLPMEPSVLRAQNNLSLQAVSLDTNATSTEALIHAGWSLRKTECTLELAYTRPPLIAELARFPETLVEERLLTPETDFTRAHPTPLFTVLLPGISSLPQLQAAAILAARLGQIRYLSRGDWRLAPLESWGLESQVRHTVLLARRDQLGGMQLPPTIASSLSALSPGQGLLAEFFLGPIGQQHRAVLVTGADDNGLEIAAWTIGSAPALASLSGSPAVLTQKPALISLDGSETPAPKVEGLYQLQELLLADRYGRQAAYLLPAGSSLAQVSTLFGIWMELGRRLPDSPVLWPTVATYKNGGIPSSERLTQRNVLIFGSVPDWPHALPRGSDQPALRLATSSAEFVTIQGRRQRRAELDPTLAFAQLMPSPWSATNVAVFIGGWNDYAIRGAEHLLLAPDTPAKLAGNLAAMDDLGRAASYELRHVASESFAERLRRLIPPGASVEETARSAAGFAARRTASLEWNRTLSRICGLVLIVLVLARLALVAQQARLRRQAFEAERSAGGKP